MPASHCRIAFFAVRTTFSLPERPTMILEVLAYLAFKVENRHREKTLVICTKCGNEQSKEIGFCAKCGKQALVAPSVYANIRERQRKSEAVDLSRRETRNQGIRRIEALSAATICPVC